LSSLTANFSAAGLAALQLLLQQAILTASLLQQLLRLCVCPSPFHMDCVYKVVLCCFLPHT
jgi:hypothetical protein